ncbi:MAG TPA: hypothetical protein VNN08_19105, partial [Thermoanaerobaculia bacterium]|nr:hypothetical protein [Thermoanaerobaculia bacterium]
WTVDGGQIVGDASGDHITIALGTKTTATVSATMTADGCLSSGTGVIALQDPFTINLAAIPPARASEPLTILWAYVNGSPAQQTISGVDFGVVTLAPGARSYTYTPQTSGNKQIVIDAGLATPSSTPPVTPRRRSVAKSPVSASSCSVVHTAASYTVSECVDPTVVIDGPDSVTTGSSFQISVRAQLGAVATWTISNGSPATATGESVMITAGSSGTVDVAVRLTRGACAGRLDRSIAISAKPVCNNPMATVTAGPVSCGSAIVNATFTGIPPFQGVWSDGSLINTSKTAIARTVTMPGNYSIIRFEDAACEGTSSGVAVLPALGPTATVIGKANNCSGVDSVTVQFDGKPPFFVRWGDNTFSTINDMQVVKTFTNQEGTNTLMSGRDGTNCTLTILNDVHWHRTPKMHVEQYCNGRDFDNVVTLAVPVKDYTSPLSVTWSDGVTTTDPYDPVYRDVKPPETTTYSVVNAHDNYCSAIFDGPSSTTVYASPIPDILLGGSAVCTFSIATATLRTPPPANATINWYITGNGIILGGQGTNTIRYESGSSGLLTVGCTFTFPGDLCPTSKAWTQDVGLDPVATMSLEKPQIHAGESVLITFTVNSGTTASFSDPLNDSIKLVAGCLPNTACQALYTSSHGPAETWVTMALTSYCIGKKTVTIPLSIVP